MIFTFYSFKGGVGRSMALANIAELLFQKGLRVLMVDFDIEAPGLDNYFKNQPDIIKKRGLMDFLISYKKSVSYANLNSDNKDEVKYKKYIKKLDIERIPKEPLSNFITPIYEEGDNGGSLSIITAGRRDRTDFSSYANNVRLFDWKDFYDHYGGEDVFEWFREEINSNFDVVLIDSRTGITEIGGVSTHQLADSMLFFIAPNQQNMDGVIMMAKSLANPGLIEKGRKGRPLSLVFIPSRIDNSESGKLDEFEKKFELFNKYLSHKIEFDNSPFLDLKIPYIPYYSYMENVAAQEPISASSFELIKSYEKIISALAQLAPKESRLNKIILIWNDPKLSNLAPKPFMTKLILAAIDEISLDMLNNPTQIYVYATKNFIKNNIKINKIYTCTSDKLFFVCELAWKMMQTGIFKIKYEDFPQHIIEYFRDRIADEELQNELKSSFVDRVLIWCDTEGYYKFSHAGFIDYFVALKFSCELNCISSAYLRAYADSETIPLNLSFWERHGNPSQLTKTFGEKSLNNIEMRGVRDHLLELISLDAAKQLKDIINNAASIDSSDLKYCISNLETLLLDTGAWRTYRYVDAKQLLRQPETLIPPKPAGMDKIHAALKESGIKIELNDIKNTNLIHPQNLSIPGSGEAIDAFIKIQNDEQISESLEIARSALKRNPALKDFCLAIHAYAGLQSLFLRKFEDAEKYFNFYSILGGNEKWYHLKLGLIRLYQGKMDDAKKEALIVSDSDDLKMRARANLLLGIIERNEGNYEKSIKIYKESLNMFNSIGDQYHAGMTLANLGIAFRMQKEFIESMNYYNQALVVFENKDEYRKACVLARLGSVYRIMESYEQALKNYNIAIKIFKDWKDDIRVGLVLKEIGTTYLLLGRFDEAINNYMQALQIFKDYKDKYKIVDSFDSEALYSREGQITYNVGLAYLMKGKWNEARDYFRLALHIFQDIRDPTHICMTLVSLGSTLRMKDEFKEAYRILSQALGMIQDSGDRSMEAMILIKLGGVCRQLHDYENSIKNYAKSLIISRDMDDNARVGKILAELGTNYRKQNDFDRALTYYDQSIKIFSDLGDKARMKWIKSQIAEIALLRGDIQNALDVIQDSISDSEADSAFLREDSLINLDDIIEIDDKKEHINMAGYKAAFWKIDELGTLALRGRINRILGLTYLRKGQFGEALNYFEKSSDIIDKIDDKSQKGKILCHMGQALSGQRNYRAAVAKINEAIDIFNDLGDLIRKRWAIEQLGSIYLRMRRWEDAIRFYNMAIGPDSLYPHLGLAICYFRINMVEEWKNQCKRAKLIIEKKPKNEYELIRMRAVCCDKNEIFEYLESSLEKSQLDMELIRYDPFFQLIQDNDQFGKLINRYANIDHFDMIPFM